MNSHNIEQLKTRAVTFPHIVKASFGKIVLTASDMSRLPADKPILVFAARTFSVMLCSTSVRGSGHYGSRPDHN